MTATGQVNALAVDSNDNLYVSGRFVTAGVTAASRVAKWDGSTWSALGSGVNSILYDLTLDNSGNLFAGGNFETAGDKPSSRIAKWIPPIGHLEVIKVLDPNDDDDEFNLQIDGIDQVTQVGHLSTTGEIEVSVGVYTVGETAFSGTDLSNYTTRIECKDQDGAGSIVAAADDVHQLQVTVNTDDDIVYTITNTLGTLSPIDPSAVAPQTATNNDGVVEMTIPPSVLPNDAANLQYVPLGSTPTVAVTDGLPASSQSILSFSLDLLDGADDIIANPTFAPPLTLVISYDQNALDSLGIAENSLEVYTFNEVTNLWEALTIVSQDIEFALSFALDLLDINDNIIEHPVFPVPLRLNLVYDQAVIDANNLDENTMLAFTFNE